MSVPANTQVIRAWRPPIAGVREVFHAAFTTHAYPPHTHDVWTVFIVDRGAIRYGLDGDQHGAGRSRVSVLPPHVVHDGRPATSAGFRKRVLYLETSVLAERLRAHLDEHLFEPVTIAAAAVTIGAEATQLARSFSAVFRISPHVYVMGRRLEAARDRIFRGQALADVAAEVGFHDQAHLSRRFNRFLGTTPGRFRSASRVPSGGTARSHP